MEAPATGNYQTCCRLCLCEKVEDLKSVYDESIDDRSLPQKISHFLSIEISNPDKLTTLVCSQCVGMINNWQEYKIQCSQNQIKLAEWFHRTTNVAAGGMQGPFLNGFGEPIQIKTEPVDDMPNENGMVMPWIKSEPMEPDISLEAVYDDFETMQHTPPLRENREPVEERTCSICNKEFSSSHNRKKHEKQLHGRNQPMRIEHYIRKSMMEIEPAGAPKPPEESEPKEQAEPPTEAEQQKILFAAGLKLLQTDSTPISCEELSKIEYSYIDKCKAMLNMHRNLECACHKVQHANIKGLLSHLRSLRIWFPVFTCYNCMITFTDRSTFTRHNVRCPNSSLDTLTKLSNLRKRSEVKTRLYQNFKCTNCCFMFSFHEDYIKHVDEEHCDVQLPCECSCTRNFENLEDYKDHVYVSCMVEYYCDICFITTKTLDEFQKHAVDTHDSSEGFILLQDDNYKMRKPPVLSPKEAVDESVILTGKRERRMSKVPLLELEDEEETSTKYYDPTAFGTPRSFCKTCPICGKEYSSYNNMMRHYKTHPEAVVNSDGEPVGLNPDLEDGSYYSCPDCGGVYSAEEWQDHLSLKHKPISCGECGKIFQFQTELDQHRSVHLNIKVYRDSKTHSLKTAMISPSQENAGEEEDNAVKLEEKTNNVEDNSEKANQQEKELVEDMESETVEVTPEIEIRDKRFYCQPCDKHFPNYGSLWEHNKRHHSESKPVANTYPKQCPNCDKVLQTGAAYARHKMIHEKPPADASNKLLVVKRDSSAEEESYHTCKKCFKVFSSKYNLKNHLKTHGIRIHSPTGKRPTIKKEVEDEDSQEASTSNGPLLYTCDICVMSYTTKMGLRKHKETHAQEDSRGNVKKVYCKYCKIPFHSVMALTKHMHEEHDENVKSKGNSISQKSTKPAFTCHICKKSFSTSPALATHIGWHKRGNLSASSKVLKVVKTEKQESPSLANPFQCTTCLAVLPNDTALQVHILEKHRSVSAIMLVPRCNTCNQDFNTQDEYETHKRLHDFLERQKQHEEKMKSGQVQVPNKSGKNFPCKYCPAGFSRSDTLGAHIRQFHKEFVKTEFRCLECDRVFDKANSLSIHMKVHEKQRANVAAATTAKPLFSCSICNMGFDLPKDLRAHTISTHPF